ncbi:hypothetical protein MXD59_21790 [Frankia sp. Ag45/Mut15]|uniref:Uncharacterized protein n=1 Tax=Frankia umida TaxID=573489 RepID=A0ABT0K3K8_9ACTN|nr:hypothetical protein [Frankia umida]MCK9878370.1 hypothetical protein [Frankia umida]
MGHRAVRRAPAFVQRGLELGFRLETLARWLEALRFVVRGLLWCGRPLGVGLFGAARDGLERRAVLLLEAGGLLAVQRGSLVLSGPRGWLKSGYVGALRSLTRLGPSGPAVVA